MSHQTHSLSQRRAVPGRRKRFDILLTEHKNRARERERERELHQPHSQQNPSLRDPHPSTHLAAAHDTYQVAHGNGPAPDATKPLPLSKPKFHSSGLPRYVLLQCLIYFKYDQSDKPAVITGRWSKHSFSCCLTRHFHLTQTKQQSWRGYPRRPYSSPRVATPSSNCPWWVFPTLQWRRRKRGAGGQCWQTGLSLFRLSPPTGGCKYIFNLCAQPVIVGEPWGIWMFCCCFF